MSDKLATVDFGAPTTFGAHLFRVEISEERNEPVVIVEDYGYHGQEAGIPRDEERIALARPVWSAIADIARREFNDRLKSAKVLTGRWHTGTNLVDRLLGKEARDRFKNAAECMRAIDAARAAWLTKGALA